MIGRSVNTDRRSRVASPSPALSFNERICSRSFSLDTRRPFKCSGGSFWQEGFTGWVWFTSIWTILSWKLQRSFEIFTFVSYFCSATAAPEPLRRQNMIPAGKVHFVFLSAGQLIKKNIHLAGQCAVQWRRNIHFPVRSQSPRWPKVRPWRRRSCHLLRSVGLVVNRDCCLFEARNGLNPKPLLVYSNLSQDFRLVL